ncbi:TPA: putative 3',5'-cyclic phosphodiesterase pde-3 [Trebouxia sp. C0005]
MRSAHATQDTYRCLFHNVECAAKVGTPRTPAEYREVLARISADKRRQWYDWTRSIRLSPHLASAKDAYALAGYDCHASMPNLKCYFWQENKHEDGWLQLHDVMQPVFDVSKLDLTATVKCKPIKLRLKDHCVTAVMCQIRTDHDKTLIRQSAMQKRTSLFALMFAEDGTLLNANQAALRKFGPDCLAMVVQLVGGQAEAIAAYEKAYEACFKLGVESYRHPIPRISSKTGELKWSMMEMWPMTDPITGKPAVLVIVHNITQQKRLELQLAQRHEALQRANQDLEQNRIQMERQTAAIQREKDALQQEARSLAQRLEAVIHDKFIPKSHIDADTPIDKTLNFLHAFIAGAEPSVQSALDIYHVLTESNTDLRQPVGLESQLLQKSSMDTEVGMSMLQLLTGPAAFREGTNPDPEGSSMPSRKSLSRQTSMLKGTDRCQQVLISEASISASLTPQLERMLQDADTNWQFDIFAFSAQAEGHALSLLSFHFFERFNVAEKFGMDPVKLATFVRVIEKGYDPQNPYHNRYGSKEQSYAFVAGVYGGLSPAQGNWRQLRERAAITHVASVVQMTHLLLHQGGVAKVMTDSQICSTYYAALIHDFEHLGVNNDYLIKTFHPLAVMYNDISPLENHHVAAAVRVMFRPECMFCQRLATDTALFRPVVVNQVLGTDMKKHFDITSRFQTAFKRSAPSSALSSDTRADSATGTGTGSDTSRQAPATDSIDWDNAKADDKMLVFQMLLKCADIGHLAAAPDTHKRWAYQLEEEFFQQGDREKEIGLPVSPLMDRSNKGGITRSQMGFFSIVGLPMFKAMADVFEGAQPMLDGVMANYRSWEAAAAAADNPG